MEPNASIAELLTRPIQTRETASRITTISLPVLDRAIKDGDLKVRRIGRRVLIPTIGLLRWAGADEAADQLEQADRTAPPPPG